MLNTEYMRKSAAIFAILSAGSFIAALESCGRILTYSGIKNAEEAAWLSLR
jgi:hypothetical protein